MHRNVSGSAFSNVLRASVRGVALSLAVAVLSAFTLEMSANAQVTTQSATALRAMKIVRGGDATVTNSTTFVDLPGATAQFSVPPGANDLFLAHYSAESVCFGTAGWCSVRVLVNGSEAAPAVGFDFAFDSTDDGNASADGWESHAVDRSRRISNTTGSPMTVTVKVQYAVTDPGIELRLDDWQFVVEQLH